MTLPYLSPSSINQFYDDLEEFFLRYVVRVPRPLQTKPMAIGSAFDSCIKAYLVASIVEDNYSKARHSKLYSEYLADTVEKHLLDWARPQGILIFNMYKETGALDHLIRDIEPGSLQPLSKVKRDITFTVDGESTTVTLLGKPDLLWISKAHGCKIVDDWKCNGACSKHNKSPNPGYIDLFPTRAIHKTSLLVDGVNVADVHPMYELQLTVYGLLTDASIVGINQLVFGKCEPPLLGELRVALHRHRVTFEMLERTKRQIVNVWKCVQAYEPGGAFGDIPAKRCQQLMRQSEVLSDPIERMLSGR